jgi:hypothetical protein
VSPARCFLAATALTSIFFINFCATIFACGCTWLWSGADAHCNVHRADGRHCPWCAQGIVASVIPWALIVAVQAAVSFWPRPLRAAVRLFCALAAFPVAGAVIAVAYGLSLGYWK